jgi:hypothetical protein
LLFFLDLKFRRYCKATHLLFRTSDHFQLTWRVHTTLLGEYTLHYSASTHYITRRVHTILLGEYTLYYSASTRYITRRVHAILLGEYTLYYSASSHYITRRVPELLCQSHFSQVEVTDNLLTLTPSHNFVQCNTAL